MSRPKIFLRDPWDDVTNKDSGWGNRLITWLAACILNKSMGNNHIIKVLPEEFPELTLINFPNTEYTTLYEINKKTTPIVDIEVEEWIKNDKIKLNNQLSYTNAFTYGNTLDLVQAFFDPKTDTFSSVKIKNKIIHEKIKATVQDRTGIHIRRGSGVYLDQHDILSIPRGYMKYYTVCPKCDPDYTFIRDQIYFDIIDDLIKKDKNAKFFIGIDVDENAIEYYKTKYPGRIKTCKDIVKENKKVLNDAKFLDPRLQLKDMGYDLLDFFSLSYTKTIIHSPPSSWSYMASHIGGHPQTFAKSEMTSGRVHNEYNNLNYANHNKNEYKLQFISRDNII